MTSGSRSEELKEQSHRRQWSSSDSFGQSRLTCFCSSHFARLPSEGRFFSCSVACLTWLARLRRCGSEVNSKGACVRSPCLCWQLCDFFPYPWFFFLIYLCCHFSWHLSTSHFVISLKCRIWIVLQITVRRSRQSGNIEALFWKCIISERTLLIACNCERCCWNHTWTSIRRWSHVVPPK